MAGIDFRLPLSDTSTHKSVNPSLLRIITSNGQQEYDGSTLVEINVSGSSVASAASYSGGSVGSVDRAIYLDSDGVPQQTNPMFVLAKANTVTGVTTFNANVIMNSSTTADSLTAGSLIVSGNTSLVNNTHASTILPHTHNTYDLGSTSLRWKHLYIGSADSYGGTYKPIYWNAGVPQAVSDNSMIVDLESTTSVSVFQASPEPGITGTLGVGHGGTGKTSWTANQLLLATSTSALGQLAAGANTAVLMQTTSGPEWKTQDQLTVGQANALTTSITLKVDLQSTSSQAVNSGDNVKLGVEGVLPIAYGGTGKSSWTAGKMVYINGSNAIDELTAGTTNQILAQGANGPTWINQSDISAGSASSLSASPTLQVDLASTSAVNFDGANGATPGVKNTLGVGNGGTGKSSWNKYGVVYASETTTLSDVVAAKKGSILVTTTSQAPTWLAPGNSGYVLQAKGEASPQWVDPSGFSVSEAASYSGGAVGDEDTAIYIDSSGVPNACNAMLVLDNDNSVTGDNTFSGQNIFTNITKFNANVQLNSSTTADSLTAGSLVVSGNTSLVNTTTTGHILPHTDSTYNIGSDANRYANVYADTLYGSGSNITSLDASNISSGTLSADRLATSGATAGGYGDTSNQTPGHGSTFKVPYVKVDDKGRVTEISEHTVTLPGSGNTHYTTYLYATTETGTSNTTSVTNGNLYLRLFDDTTARSSIKIYGSGAVSVTTDANGAIKINATNSRDAGYGKITPAGDTGTNVVTANTTQITAKSYNEAFTFKTGNKWLTIAGTESTTAGSDVLTIGHATVTVTTTDAPDDNQQNPGYGSTFKIPKITVDGAGHVTAIGSTLVKIPASDQSDYRVQQDGNNENKEFSILLKNTNDYNNETASTTKFVNTTNKPVQVNPSTGTLSAAQFQVDQHVKLQYDSGTNSLQFVFA